MHDLIVDRTGPEEQPRHRLATQWGDFLDQYQWDFFVTLTTRFDRSPAEVEYALKRGFLRTLAQVAQGRVSWFYSIEHDFGVRPHAHLLIASQAPVPRDSVARAWPHGVSDVQAYRRGGKAASYVAKWLALPDALYDISAPPLVARRV
jgi:hypothetical protein